MEKEPELGEGESFPFLRITEQESRKFAEISHSVLLEKTFNAFTSELDTNVNTPKFKKLRKEYGDALVAYWENKRMIVEKAKKEGLVQKEYIVGDERISVSQVGVWGRNDEPVLEIKRRTKTEEDDVFITVSRETGLMFPQTIRSEIRTDPEESSDIFYEVKFKEGKIITFRRTLIKSDPEGNHLYIKDTRIIDFSSFTP